jgi:hypothetical protein
VAASRQRRRRRARRCREEWEGWSCALPSPAATQRGRRNRAQEGSARRLELRARPFRFQRAVAKAVELAHGIAQDAARRIFFTACYFAAPARARF